VRRFIKIWAWIGVGLAGVFGLALWLLVFYSLGNALWVSRPQSFWAVGAVLLLVSFVSAWVYSYGNE